MFNRNTKSSLLILGSHALIIGGGIAGLLASRVLSDRFEKVTVVERGFFPKTLEGSEELSQSFPHILLRRGQQILEEIFPGIKDELIASGAAFFDPAKDIAWLTTAGMAVRAQAGYTTLSFTKSLLVGLIYRRLAEVKNIQFLEEKSITGLLSNDNQTGISGVRVRDCNSQIEECLNADLVVDASGLSSQASRWLKKLGYQSPKEESFDDPSTYIGRFYEISSDFPGGLKGIYLQTDSLKPVVFAALYPFEANRYCLGMVSMTSKLSKDEKSFLELVRCLPNPLIYEMVKEAKPLVPVSVLQAPKNRRRYFERLTRYPEGFVVLGDANCSLTPVYGQGITIIALQAMAMAQCLYRQSHKRSLLGLAKKVQVQISKVYVDPWAITIMQNSHGFGKNFVKWYFERVTELITKDSKVFLSFLKVIHLLEPSVIFFQPSFLVRVLKQAILSKPRVKSMAKNFKANLNL
jgi:flavin-dependent dehydrogenase